MKTSRKTILTMALMTASPLSLILGAAPVAAQDKSYDIKAQPLASAILEYSRQSNIAVLAPMDLVKGKNAPAVGGNLSAAEALNRLLAGSGLRAVRGANGGMTLVRSASGNASGAANGGAQQGQAVLVGSVRDHATGAALKGARVEVVETGETTSTGDLGDFRFAKAPIGEVTLRISYLGFPEQTETVSVVGGLTNRTDIYLGSGATTEIVVIGQVSARAQALNQERTAENSTTVISGDLLGNFNGTTIADSLRRAPGVSFQKDQNTGDGTNIIVRGLSPDYNQVNLNGVPLPTGVTPSAIGRSPNLNNLLSDSVSEIKISKTLLASQDSAGTGGLVEIETKSPLDRPKRYFNFSADGTKRAKGFGDEYLLSGTASMRFGAEGNFGISASVQYRDQTAKSYNYSTQGIYGAYLPLLPNGQPASPASLNPRTTFPFYDGAEYLINRTFVGSNETRSRTRTISLASEWQVSDATNLQLTYVQANQKRDQLTRFYEIGDTFAFYTLQPVPGLAGEPRYVYGDSYSELYPIMRADYSPDSTSNSDIVSLRGTSTAGALTLKYGAGYTRSSSREPFRSSFSIFGFPGVAIDGTNFLPEAIRADTGTIVTKFGPRVGRGIPVPLLTEAGFEALRAANSPQLGAFTTSDGRGRSENWQGELSGKYEFGSGILKYIEAGGEYRRSRYRQMPISELGYEPVRDENYLPVPVETVGLEFENLPFASGTANLLYRLPTQASILQYIGNLDQYADDGYLIRFDNAPDPLLAKQGTREQAMIGFIQARADIGKLEIISGVRMDRTHVEASFANSTIIIDQTGAVDVPFLNATRIIYNDSDTLTSYLPRILVNYRPTENIVVRAGYFSTVARPQISLLNNRRTISYDARRIFGPTGTQPQLAIQAGNPGLKPARTHNFDLSAEWYDGRVGVLKAGLFYKRINNLLENNSSEISGDLPNFELPDHPLLNNLPDDVIVRLNQPVNADDPATIWGVELAAERQLTFLPGILAGLGIYANYTYSDSKKTQKFSYLEPVFDANGNLDTYREATYERELPFAQSPKHSGTVGLTYTRNGFDGTLYYTAQSRRFSGVGEYGLDYHNEAVRTLDFRATYRFKVKGSDVRIAFEGLDLLKGKGDPDSEVSYGGVGDQPKYYTAGYFLGGRRFSLGLSATF